MADTFSNLLRLRLQQTGANTNTWGALLNAAAIQLIEDSISGAANVVVAGSDVTLSTVNGANDQARMAVINLTGSPGAARNIVVPSLSKPYIVINTTGFDMTVKTAAGTGVAVPTAARQYVYCDGTNVVAVQADVLGTVATATNALQLGGVLAANYARKDAFNQHTKGFATTFVALTDASTIAVDCTASNRFRVVLEGNRALTLSDPADGQTIEIWFVQDAGGSRTISWPANVRFGTGSSATLSTGAAAIDAYKLTYHLSSDLWIAQSVRNVSAASGATTFDVSLTANSFDLNLFAALGSPSGIVTVNLTIPQGVIVAASSTGTAAIDTSGFDSGSEINLFNSGYALGKGGRAGRGAHAQILGGDDDSFQPAVSGRAGGAAILGPGAGRTLNITNATGFIWGGGGGGGGGGVSYQNSGSNHRAVGGGGGGGAGGGAGGDPGTTNTALVGTPGGDGSTGVNGALGAGGAGASSGTASGGAGGSGGDWGAAGSAGVGPTSQAIDVAAGTGGAAGAAVSVNGATVTFLSGSGSPNVKGTTA